MQKTFMQKPLDVKRTWHLLDCRGQVLGKLAVKAALLIQGKHKKEYTPYADSGDFVVVINARDIVLTGKKETEKVYTHFSGYPGGITTQTVAQVRKKYPERLITQAVYNMIPDNKLRTARMLRLKVYAGETHPHQAQLNPALKSDKS